MAEQDKKRDTGADGGGQSGAHNAVIQRKDEEVIAEYIEDTAGQYGDRSQGRGAVVAQEGREHLVEHEQRDHKLDGQQVLLGQGKQRFVGAEQPEHRLLKQQDRRPAHQRQPGCFQQGGGEELVLAAPALLTAPGGAEQD